MAEKSITSLKGKIEELTAKSAELSSPSLQCFEIFFYFDIETATEAKPEAKLCKLVSTTIWLI